MDKVFKVYKQVKIKGTFPELITKIKSSQVEIRVTMEPKWLD